MSASIGKTALAFVPGLDYRRVSGLTGQGKGEYEVTPVEQQFTIARGSACESHGGLREMFERFGSLWCRVFHDAPMWPLSAGYRCRTCGRVQPVPWSLRHSG